MKPARLRTLYDLTLLLHTPWNILGMGRTFLFTWMGRLFLLAALAVLLLLASIVATAPPASASPVLTSSVTVMADGPPLEIKGKAPKTGYSREQFGPAWADVDGNGCDTRNDILQRDLPDETIKPGTNGCVVLTGTLTDQYTGKVIHFVRGPNSRVIEIDHVISLSNAWQTGAQGWSPEKRRAFANDPLNLMAVDGPTNQAKGAGDAATWLPPNKSFRPEFVSRQLQVKIKYGLWATQAEYDATLRAIWPVAPVLL